MKRKVSDLLRIYDEASQLFRIRGDSEYFRDKYETPNPYFIIRADNKKVQQGGCQDAGPAYSIAVTRCLPAEGKSYYGHVLCEAPGDKNYSRICLLGEVVHESELEPVKEAEIDVASSQNITFENMNPLFEYSRNPERCEGCHIYGGTSNKAENVAITYFRDHYLCVFCIDEWLKLDKTIRQIATFEEFYRADKIIMALDNDKTIAEALKGVHQKI